MRPLPVRVLVTMNTPFDAAYVEALVLRAARRARAGPRDHDPLRAVVHRGLDQIAGRALVHHDHVDARQLA